MRIVFLVIFFFFFISNVPAQSATGVRGTKQRPQDTPYSVVSRDANSRVWERAVHEKSPDGEWVSRVHRVEELGTGMHHKEANGDWVESKEQIDLLPDGAAQAVHGLHQA